VQAVQLSLLLGSAPDVRLAYGPDVRAGSILIGCLVALVLFERRRPTLHPTVAAVALAFFVGILFSGFGRALFAGPILVFGAACACLIVLALDRGTWVARALSVAPLVGLGRISYSLYLWHMPILVWLGADNGRFELLDAAAIALSVGAAIASYRLVERPFLRRRHRPAAAGRRERAPSPLTPARLEPAGRARPSMGTASAL
jgi:peptidoglycan/LPS O-acetylase OafA/YrhL